MDRRFSRYLDVNLYEYTWKLLKQKKMGLWEYCSGLNAGTKNSKNMAIFTVLLKYKYHQTWETIPSYSAWYNCVKFIHVQCTEHSHHFWTGIWQRGSWTQK